MQQNPPPLVAQVWGIPISQPNPEKVKLVKAVVGVSILGAVFRLMLFLWSMYGFDGGDPAGFWSESVGLFLSLLIPLCGYFGAKNSNKELICWFTGMRGGEGRSEAKRGCVCGQRRLDHSRHHSRHHSNTHSCSFHRLQRFNILRNVRRRRKILPRPMGHKRRRRWRLRTQIIRRDRRLLSRNHSWDYLGCA